MASTFQQLTIRRRYQLNNSKKKYQLLIIFFVFILFSIVPIFFSHIYKQQIVFGHDIEFHIGRIIGLSESIQHKIFFPKINPFFIDGAGYASSIFYSDIFIYIPAFLVLTGLSPTKAYVVFIILINFATLFIAYYSMKSVNKDRLKSFLFATLYTLASYRLFDMTTRAALGELLAFVFLPLALLGIYQIFYGNQKKWYLLSLGMCGILLSHIISTLIFSVFIFVFVLINIKKIKIYLPLLKATLLTLVLSAFYLVPIIEQLASNTFIVDKSPILLSNQAKDFGTYFLYALSNNVKFPNIGIVILVFSIIFFPFVNKFKNSFTKNLFVISFIFLFLTSSLFPWKLLNHSFFSVIQFPWRLFIISTLGLTWTMVDNSLWTATIKKVSLLSSIALILSISFSINALNVDGKKTTYTELDNVSSFAIGGGQEYLLKDTNFGELLNKKTKFIHSDNIKITNYRKIGNQISFNFKTDKKETAILPLLYYKGYSANVVGNGSVTNLKPNNDYNNFISVDLTGNGKFFISYKPTMAQQISFIVSLISVSILIFYCLILINKKKTLYTN